ncbi:hypothetical protein ACKI16_43675 [Streptomyces scabiei]
MIDPVAVEHYGQSDADTRRASRAGRPGLSASPVGQKAPIVAFLIGRPDAGKPVPKWRPTPDTP